jgi:hypothetical protein
MNSNISPNYIGPNTQPNGQVKTTERYVSQFCQYRVELSSQINEIAHIQSLFDGTEIWPDQCEHAIRKLTMMRKPIRNLFNLLNSLHAFPPEIKINRYSVIVESQQVDDQARELISLLSKYRNLSNASNKQGNKEQNDIDHKMHQISEKCKLLVQSLDRVINQVMSINTKTC